MVNFTKTGKIKWSKEEQESLIIFYNENADPSLSERAKFAKQLGVPVKKVTGWIRYQKTKMKKKLKIPNFLKKQKTKTKLKVDKIANVEESHIKEADVDFKEPVDVTKPRVIKLRKYSKEREKKRDVFRIIQSKRDCRKPIGAPSRLKSNTDINFLDTKASTEELLSQQQIHEAVDRFVNADFSESETEDFNEDPTLLDDIDLTDKSLDVSFFESGQLDSAFIETKEAVDYSNIQDSILNTTSPLLNPDLTLNTFLTDFNNDLKKCADANDLDNILDLHVQMISDSDLDDENEEMNAFQPVY